MALCHIVATHVFARQNQNAPLSPASRLRSKRWRWRVGTYGARCRASNSIPFYNDITLQLSKCNSVSLVSLAIFQRVSPAYFCRSKLSQLLIPQLRVFNKFDPISLVYRERVGSFQSVMDNLHQPRNNIAETCPNDVSNEVICTGEIAPSHGSTAAHENPINQKELETTEDGSPPVHKIGSEDPDVSMHQACVLLCYVGMDTLRDIYSRWELSPTGAKGYLVAKAMSLFKTKVLEEKVASTEKILGEDVDWGYRAFLKDWAMLHRSKPKPRLDEMAAIAQERKSSAAMKARLAKIPELKFQPGKKRKRKLRDSPTGKKTRRGACESGATGVGSYSSSQIIERMKKASRGPTTMVTGRKKMGEVPKNDAAVTATDNEEEVIRRPRFCIREFVRLIYILSIHEKGRLAYKDSSQTRTRIELDAKRRSSHVWTEHIAPLFNSITVQPKSRHEHLYPDLDPAPAPATERTGGELHNAWTNFRPDATEWYHKYNLSGQNEKDFSTFLIDGAAAGVPSINSVRGMKLIVGAIVLKLHEKPDRDVLGNLSRLIDPIDNAIGTEEGLGASSRRGPSPGRRSSKRASRSSLDLQQSLLDKNTAIQQASESIREFCSSKNAPSDKMHTVHEREELLSTINKAVKAEQDAPSLELKQRYRKFIANLYKMCDEMEEKAEDELSASARKKGTSSRHFREDSTPAGLDLDEM